jgi:hypothetical protein
MKGEHPSKRQEIEQNLNTTSNMEWPSSTDAGIVLYPTQITSHQSPPCTAHSNTKRHYPLCMTTTSSKASKHAKQAPAFPSARHIYIVSLLMVQICRITCHKETLPSNHTSVRVPSHHRQTDSPDHASDLVVACLRIGNSNPPVWCALNFRTCGDSEHAKPCA